MEPQAQTESPAFVYDTLTALSFSDSNPSPTLNQSPVTNDDSHLYSVFRNEISDLTVDTTPVVSETVDFFSLDVDAGTNDNSGGFVTPVVSKKKNRKRKKDEAAEESRLESNWFSENSFSKIPMLQLHKEIVDFCEFLMPTDEEKSMRDEAMDGVRSVIQYIWPNCKVEVFGSYRTGLYLPTSDIDVVILESGITNPQLGLRALSRALSQRGIAKNILVIAKAPMLIAFLKYLKDGRSPPEHNLGVLLVKFFDFYGRKLNTADVGVSCKMGGSFFSKYNKGFANTGRPGLISIEDPQTPDNDIGKNSFNYFQIRSAFSMALSTLTNTKAILALGPNRSILGTIIRPDRILLERKGGKNGDVTFNSLLPGAGEPLPMSTNDGLSCNWQLDEDEEGSFPRGNTANGDITPVVDTPGNQWKDSSQKKKKKKNKKSKSKNVDEDEKGTSSKKRRRQVKPEFSWSY
ncbi:hypothetical protein AALP_AA8G320800 [Arabis alpina]|uniref:Polymerase nucleotidyl transferase domain-containing protein n=1 Tax=Arabis alpina TaxID=50452 RepID=A0A087GAU5_ARAAL|nr:hypothetical protein AALP_AA8G320800 [Arabis alpina]